MYTADDHGKDPLQKSCCVTADGVGVVARRSSTTNPPTMLVLHVLKPPLKPLYYGGLDKQLTVSKSYMYYVDCRVCKLNNTYDILTTCTCTKTCTWLHWQQAMN